MRRICAFILGASLTTSVIYCDSISAIKQLHKRNLSSCVRHIRTNLGFVCDATDDGGIVVEHTRTMKSPANTFTATENHDRFRASVTILSGQTA